ncbi:hypothetical protein [Streptomyces sp. MMS24-I29]|uniref:hypothetical protein n=1 Tax=Streptomyces sp. MMS24-I29 TaxID=3351480 RepID=UPI003C7CE52C
MSPTGTDNGTEGIARGLIERGLVEVITSPVSYYGQRKGWRATRIVISDLKINDRAPRP